MPCYGFVYLIANDDPYGNALANILSHLRNTTIGCVKQEQREASEYFFSVLVVCLRHLVKLTIKRQKKTHSSKRKHELHIGGCWVGTSVTLKDSPMQVLLEVIVPMPPSFAHLQRLLVLLLIPRLSPVGRSYKLPSHPQIKAASHFLTSHFIKCYATLQ